MSMVFCAALMSVIRLLKASAGLPTSVKPESLRVPAVAARAATACPSRVSSGVASAVETGRSTSLGSEAQPLIHALKSTTASQRQAPPDARALVTKAEPGGRAAVGLVGMR